MVVLAGITRIFNPEVLILYKVCHFVSWSTSGELSSTYAELKHCCLLHYKSRVNLVNCCLEAENPSAAANMTCAEYYILRISRWSPRWDMVIRIGKKWDFSVLLFLVLARKAYNLKQNFCSLGVVPVFVSFFLPLNTNKKINKYYRLVYFFLMINIFRPLWIMDYPRPGVYFNHCGWLWGASDFFFFLL